MNTGEIYLADTAWGLRPMIVVSREELLAQVWPNQCVGDESLTSCVKAARQAVGDRMGALMRRPFDWSGDVKKLTMPVMLVYGDGDMFRLEHIVEFYQLLGGGLRDAGWMREHLSRNRLAILPDRTHYDTFLAPEMATTVLPFLNGERRGESWDEQVGDPPGD
jgi:pimeloyl-ACP methyl ester carboxylesterase